jgi:hypothetical protein
MMRLLAFTCMLGFAAAADTDGLVQLLARQLILAQSQQEQYIRTAGGSGLTDVRQYDGGSQSFHDASYINSGVANIHEHTDFRYTIGMGEIGAVLNGVAFTSRHNDYALNQPSKTSQKYNAVQKIDDVPVPPAVLAKATVQEQVDEMRLWFKAWQEQDTSVRDYRPYFKPVLSYLEGTWIKDHGELKEPFASDRHFTDAKTWDSLHEKTRFLMASGSKNNAENLPTLPSKITGMGGPNNDIPETANFEYRIAAHPIEGDVPLGALKLAGDMQAQLRTYPAAKTNVQVSHGRDARFELNSKNSTKFFEGRTAFEFMDSIMAQIPGKDSYAGKISDYVMGELTVPFAGGTEALNTAYYSRYYSVLGKDASGRTRRKRGFNDGNLWAAQTTQPKVAGLRLNDGFGITTCPLKRKCVEKFAHEMGECNKSTRKCNTHSNDDRWKSVAKKLMSSRYKDCPNWTADDSTYHRDEFLLCRDAIIKSYSDRNGLAKIVTPTPKDPTCGPLYPKLSEPKEWAKCKRDKNEQKWSWAIPLEVIWRTPLITWNPYNLKYSKECTVAHADDRDGDPTDPAKAYDGNCRESFYQTPIEFFKGGTVGDAADTARGTAGVLDQDGVLRKVAPSGIRVNMNIKDVGTHVRQRYPIFPLHAEGSAIWKELKSLEAVELTGDTAMTSKVREEAMGITFELTFANGHTHVIHVDGHTLVTDLAKEGSEKVFTSSLANGHEHAVTIKRVADNKFQMVKMEPPEPHTLMALGDVGSVKETGLKTKTSSSSSWSSSDSSSKTSSADTKKALDSIAAFNKKIDERMKVLESKITSATEAGKCDEMKDMKDMLASLTKAVASSE